MATSVGASVKDLIGNNEIIGKINADALVTESIGKAGIEDILKELARPGRDPRRKFTPVQFDDAVRSVQDVQEGMVLPGMVTNVTDFGAFVDIGVGQDGLVHLSELTHRFVRDPRQIVRVGDSVRVKVIAVDRAAPRISFSMKAIEPKRAPRRKPRKPGPARETAVSPAPAGEHDAQRRRGPARAGEIGTRPEPRRGRENDSRRGDTRNGARPDERRDGTRRRAHAQQADTHREGERQRREGRPDRKKRRERAPRGDGAISRPVQATVSNTPLNTQLADQLAELRDKLRAG
jgi:transcriptional accessory protein Tex/SPT6